MTSNAGTVSYEYLLVPSDHIVLLGYDSDVVRAGARVRGHLSSGGSACNKAAFIATVTSVSLLEQDGCRIGVLDIEGKPRTLLVAWELLQFVRVGNMYHFELSSSDTVAAPRAPTVASVLPCTNAITTPMRIEVRVPLADGACDALAVQVGEHRSQSASSTTTGSAPVLRGVVRELELDRNGANLQLKLETQHPSTGDSIIKTVYISPTENRLPLLGLIDGAELEFRALRAMASYSLYGHDSTVHVVRHAPVRTSAIAPPATLRGDWSRIDEDASAAACRLLAELPAAGDGVAAVLTGTITGVSHLSVAKRYACSLYFFWLVRVRSLAEDACHHRRCTNGECECTTDRCLHAPTAIFSIDDGTGDALARIDGDFELFWQLLIILGVYVVVLRTCCTIVVAIAIVVDVACACSDCNAVRRLVAFAGTLTITPQLVVQPEPRHAQNDVWHALRAVVDASLAKCALLQTVQLSGMVFRQERDRSRQSTVRFCDGTSGVTQSNARRFLVTVLALHRVTSFAREAWRLVRVLAHEPELPTQ